jgi:hypothetical protein
MTSIFAGDLFETALFRRLQERREIYDLISAAAPFQLTFKFGQRQFGLYLRIFCRSIHFEVVAFLPVATLLATRAGKVISRENNTACVVTFLPTYSY